MSDKKASPAKRPARTKKAAAPAASKDPFQDAKKVSIQGDYYFEPGEKQALGMSLATLYTKQDEIAAHKKDLTAQLNAQAAGVSAEIKGTVNKIRSGFEPREMEVFVLFHNPQKGQKSFYRTDSRALVRSEMMLPSDYEQELPMPGLPPPVPMPAPKPPKAPKGGKGNVPPGGDDGAGSTSLADALNAAAAGLDLQRVPFDVNESDEPKDIAKKFTKAAGKFGWPQAAIAILRDEVKKQEVGYRAAETLAPHITPKTPPTVDAGAAE